MILVIFNPQTAESLAEIKTLKGRLENMTIMLHDQHTSDESFLRYLEEKSDSQESTINTLQSQLKTSLEVLARQERVIYQLQLQANNSRQENLELELKVQDFEQKAETYYNRNIQILYESLHKNVSSSQQEIKDLKLRMEGVKIGLSTKFNDTEKQLQAELSYLSKKFLNDTSLLNEAVNQRLSKVESQVNTTAATNLQQINIDLELENITTSLAMSIAQLEDSVNQSSEDIQTVRRQVNQSTIAVRMDLTNLTQRIDHLHLDEPNFTGSKQY